MTDFARATEVVLIHALVTSILGLLSACQSPAGIESGSHGTRITDQTNRQDELPYDKSIAFLKLSQIKPHPSLPPPATEADQTSDRALRQIENAEQLFGEDRYSEAIQRLERALRYSPNSLMAHQLMARVCLQAGNSARAKEHLDKALQIDQANSETHYLLGRAYALEGMWPEALLQLRTLDLCDDLEQHREIAVLSHYYLAQCLAQEGYVTAAIDQYQEFALRVQKPWPETAETRLRNEARDLLRSAYLNQSKLHEVLDHPIDAAQALALASKYDPENLHLIKKEAELFRRAGRYDSAVAALKRLAEKDVASALPLLISVRKQAGLSDDLLADLKTLASAHSNDDQVVRALADEYFDRGQIDLATATLRDFVSAHPENGQAAIALSSLLIKQQRWVESVEAMAGVISFTVASEAVVTEWLGKLEQSGQAKTLFGKVSERINDPLVQVNELFLIGRIAQLVEENDFAERALLKCEQLAPDFAPSRLALGRVYLNTYRWKDVIAAAEKVIALNDNDFRPYRLLGEAYLGLDDYDKAVQALNNAIRLNRSDLQSIVLLAKAYDLSDKKLQRRRQNQIILEIDPTNAEALEGLFVSDLQERQLDQAQQYLRTMEGAAELRSTYRRCKALLKLAQDRGRNAQDEYVEELMEITKAHPGDLEARMDLAQAYLNTGQYDLVQQLLEGVIAADPKHFRAQDLLCGLQIYNLNYGWAIENLRARLAIHPNRIPWQQTLVASLIDDQQYTSAAQALEQFLENSNLSGRARDDFQYDLLMSYMLSDEIGTALSALQKWIDDQPQAALLQTILINLHRLNGNSHKAVKLAEDWYLASSLSDRNTYRELLVAAYWADQRFDDAQMLMLDWLELDPDALVPTRRLMNTFRQAGKLDDAVELGKSSAPYARSVELVWDLISLYQARKDFDAALRLLHDRMAAESRNRPRNRPLSQIELDLRFGLCNVLISAGRFDVAEQELAALLRQTRNARAAGPAGSAGDQDQQVAVLRLMSLCYQLGGKQSLSIQQLEEIYGLRPEEVRINNDLGYTWSAKGTHLDQAERMIRKAVGLGPRSAAYLDSLGWVLYKKGDFQGAYDWLTRAARTPAGDWQSWLLSEKLRRGHDDPVIRDHLGDAAWRLNKKEQAVSCWQRAHQLVTEQADELLTPEQQAILDKQPAKIEAATQGGQPGIASAVTDP